MYAVGGSHRRWSHSYEEYCTISGEPFQSVRVSEKHPHGQRTAISIFGMGGSVETLGRHALDDAGVSSASESRREKKPGD
ncbi:hypothetical protein QE152_g10234 [Popillia japonica]|uniref:Uncharacterized protein n=1 Tax=Popillia japonica TaxID=7064 RepID=A0AAW1LVB9_POPJA